MPEQAPLVAYDKARIIWFERYGSAIVEKNRYFVLAMLLGLAVMGLGVTIDLMLPLKTVVPYVVRVAHNGNVEVDAAASRPYVPGQAEESYFLAHWTEKLLTLDAVLSPQYFREDYAYTRSKAIQEFTAFMASTRPLEKLQKNPSLTQSVALHSINYLDPGVALVRVGTQRQSLSGKPSGRNYVVTLHFVLVTPRTEAQILSNPIGLYITDFNVARDLS
ncbi:MAG: type IV secretion system protein [Proteobacteria bacterium]|nr:type IV secretion system protein [Pseudomonadota bacterium]